MPMIGLLKSPSPKPTARSMARLGERWIPWVIAAERSMDGCGELPETYRAVLPRMSAEPVAQPWPGVLRLSS